jgi:formyltetrahydrofolate deformylase
MDRKILLTDCRDETGIIANVTSICSRYKLNIVKNTEFVAHEQERFFMRTVLEGDFSDSFLEDVRKALPDGASARLVSTAKKRLVVMVTKETHCLGDLLLKHYAKALNLEIVAVIGNYDVLRDLTEKFNIPYHCVSHEGLTREEHCRRIMEVINRYNPDFIVLAKYMRILTPEFINAYPQKIINIHHSFLPAFIGAKPYEQAFNRGVKIIGATAHFVTEHLDEGPIIEQDVIKVDHNFSAEDMALAGRDIERLVLDHALSYVLDNKVFIYGNKTVVFRN